jgi:hypothetical protein
MRTMLTIGFSLCLAACASAASNDAPLGSTSSAEAPAPDLAGSFAFALDESAPATRVRARCASEAKGDAAKVEACWTTAAKAAAKEGIRFEKDAQGRTTFVSYGEEDGEEAVYHRAPVDVAADGVRGASVRMLAPATGALAARRPIPPGTLIRVEIVDEGTIAMNDPEKGRLVFHRIGAAR